MTSFDWRPFSLKLNGILSDQVFLQWIHFMNVQMTRTTFSCFGMLALFFRSDGSQTMMTIIERGHLDAFPFRIDVIRRILREKGGNLPFFFYEKEKMENLLENLFQFPEFQCKMKTGISVSYISCFWLLPDLDLDRIFVHQFIGTNPNKHLSHFCSALFRFVLFCVCSSKQKAKNEKLKKKSN